ncbi:hypothetical protein IGL21_002488 [Enterococcus sp. AZ037]
MIHFFRTVFTSLRPSYLIRQYIFSGLLSALFYISSPSNASTSFYILLILSFLLYPFAMFVYDSLVSLLLGDNVWFVNGLWAVIWAVIKMFFIYIFSIFIAPIGILILYFQNR